MIFLDSNVTIWCYQGNTDLLSPKVIDLINQKDLLVSPMVRLGLQYLWEIGKAKVPAQKVLDSLYRSIGLTVHDMSFVEIINNAIEGQWTRDPFDRLITAHAQAMEAPLLTKDKNIRANYTLAVW